MEALVKKYQCPGCVCGSDTMCRQYDFNPIDLMCDSHVLGNDVALGLPKGFNMPGFEAFPIIYKGKARDKMAIRLFKAGTLPKWDNFNIPVWAMVEDGDLFVRTYAPRINWGWVDVIESGTLDMVPGAFNVGEIIGDID